MANNFTMRLATKDDVARELEIFSDAKNILHSRNIPQWQEGCYPCRSDIEKDIELKQGYVLQNENNEIVAIGSIGFAPDALYDDSRFNHSEKYVILHRTAVDSNFAGQGLGQELMKHLIQTAEALGYEDVRIDTHPLNIAMHKTIMRAGFHEVGEITLPMKSDPERIAYQFNEAM